MRLREWNISYKIHTIYYRAFRSDILAPYGLVLPNLEWSYYYYIMGVRRGKEDRDRGPSVGLGL